MKILTFKEMLEVAIRLAANAHGGQMDKSGMPYILHPITVMYFLHTKDFELMAIAVLHDVVEDTKVTFQDLRDAGLSERIIEGVRSMTKMRGETYEEYKLKVKMNPDSIRVKMADLRHNMDLNRLIDTTPKDFERANKYMQFYKELESLL